MHRETSSATDSLSRRGRDAFVPSGTKTLHAFSARACSPSYSLRSAVMRPHRFSTRICHRTRGSSLAFRTHRRDSTNDRLPARRSREALVIATRSLKRIFGLRLERAAQPILYAQPRWSPSGFRLASLSRNPTADSTAPPFGVDDTLLGRRDVERILARRLICTPVPGNVCVAENPMRIAGERRKKRKEALLWENK